MIPKCELWYHGANNNIMGYQLSRWLAAAVTKASSGPLWRGCGGQCFTESTSTMTCCPVTDSDGQKQAKYHALTIRCLLNHDLMVTSSSYRVTDDHDLKWLTVTVARDSWQSRSLSDSEALPVTLWQSVWLCRWVRVLSIRKFASSVEDLQNTLADFVPVIVDCLDSSVPSVAGDFLLKASAC